MRRKVVLEKRKGFTIIELMLAMGFLSTLMVTIAFLVLQITGIYQKGLALRAVSSMGKQLIDEFSRVVGGAPITVLDDGRSSYFVKVPRDVAGGVQQGGVFCPGSYSFVWNTRDAYLYDPEDNPTAPQPLTVNGGKYKLARVRDEGRQLCAQAKGRSDRNLTISGDNTEVIELINSDESDLILYDFTVFPATQSRYTNHIFYSATFILATIRGGVNIMASGDFCEEGTTISGGGDVGLASEFNYCAVNKFNFAMRATGYSDKVDAYGD